MFDLILVIILQDETFSMLELKRLSHFESVLKRGLDKLILSWYSGVTLSMLFSNVKADQSSYWGQYFNRASNFQSVQQQSSKKLLIWSEIKGKLQESNQILCQPEF